MSTLNINVSVFVLCITQHTNFIPKLRRNRLEIIFLKCANTLYSMKS